MYRGLTVGVVVPAYNEEGYVGEVIDTLPEYVDRAYVVDDRSTDRTWEEIREHARERNRGHEGQFEDLVVPIRHERNRGVGGAIKTGYLRARSDRIDATAVLAGDAQMDPSELPRYIDPIADGVADYVKGDRFRTPSDYESMPRVRLVGNVILSYLTKVASGYWSSMDSQNGYAAISLHALETADIEGMYEYYGYCNDLLVRLNTAGLRVADVPRSSEFAYEDGWKSHIELSEYVPRVSAMLLRGFLRRLWLNYVLRDYRPIAPLYALGAGATGTGSLGLVGSLLDRDADSGSWVLTTTLGAGILVAATLLDREANADLQHQVEDDRTAEGDRTAGDGSAPADDRTAGTDARPRRTTGRRDRSETAAAVFSRLNGQFDAEGRSAATDANGAGGSERPADAEGEDPVEDRPADAEGEDPDDHRPDEETGDTPGPRTTGGST